MPDFRLLGYINNQDVSIPSNKQECKFYNFPGISMLKEIK